MTDSVALSPNTQAILLLTAPLLLERSGSWPKELLTLGQYKPLAQRLRAIGREPADFLTTESEHVIRECEDIVDRKRLQRLLGRGFQLAQSVEQWRARAIWVVSRADSTYPVRIRRRLKADAPPVLFGCGDRTLLDTGGLSVVGSRNIDDELLRYTASIGKFAANADRTIVSGGAKGVDQTVMENALAAGGKVSGVLADSLARGAVLRIYRDAIRDSRLALVSPYDPNAGFHVGRAMGRNKLIYALSDVALVVNADAGTGGTWAGAIEQLKKYWCVPVFVRSSGPHSDGLVALVENGARPVPRLDDTRDFLAWMDGADGSGAEMIRVQISMATEQRPAQGQATLDFDVTTGGAEREASRSLALPSASDQVSNVPPSATAKGGARRHTPDRSPAELLFDSVEAAVSQALSTPLPEEKVAEALDVSKMQARQWLKKLVARGIVERHERPVRYSVKEPGQA